MPGQALYIGMLLDAYAPRTERPSLLKTTSQPLSVVRGPLSPEHRLSRCQPFDNNLISC